MKTLYTLLLAFGLCFTGHAQNIINFQDKIAQSSELEIEYLNNLLFGQSKTMIVGTEINFLNSESTQIKKIIIESIKDFNNLVVNNNELQNVELIKIKYELANNLNLKENIFKKIPNLKIIYIEGNNEFSDVDLLYLKNSLVESTINTEVLYKKIVNR